MFCVLPSLVLLLFLLCLPSSSSSSSSSSPSPFVLWNLEDYFAVQSQGESVLLVIRTRIVGFDALVEAGGNATLYIGRVLVTTISSGWFEYNLDYGGVGAYRAVNRYPFMDERVHGGHAIQVILRDKEGTMLPGSALSQMWVYDFDSLTQPIPVWCNFAHPLRPASAEEFRFDDSSSLDLFLKEKGALSRLDSWSISARCLVGLQRQAPGFFFSYLLLALVENIEGRYGVALGLLDISHHLLADSWGQHVRMARRDQMHSKSMMLRAIRQLAAMVERREEANYGQLMYRGVWMTRKVKSTPIPRERDEGVSEINETGPSVDVEQGDMSEDLDAVIERSEEKMVREMINAEQTLPPSAPPPPHEYLERPSTVDLSFIMLMREDMSLWCAARAPQECLVRFRAAITMLLHQLRLKQHISAEIIIVEWNPQMTPMVDLIAEHIHQVVNPRVTIRVLTIPQEVVQNCFNPRNLTILEFLEKNAAARRANGRFLVLTNPDDVMSIPLMQQLTSGTLREDVIYMAVRGQLNGIPAVEPYPMSQYAHHHSTWDLYGSEPRGDNIGACVGHVADLALPHLSGIRDRAGEGEGWGKRDKDGEPLRYDPVRDNVEELMSLVFEDAAGDLTVISREAFVRMRGYSEYPTWSYMDGALHWTAIAHGLGQLVWKQPCGVAHQHHERSQHSGIAQAVSYPEYRAAIPTMLKMGNKCNKRSAEDSVERKGEDLEVRNDRKERLPFYAYNTDEWGLANAQLPEVELTGIAVGG